MKKLKLHTICLLLALTLCSCSNAVPDVHTDESGSEDNVPNDTGCESDTDNAEKNEDDLQKAPVFTTSLYMIAEDTPALEEQRTSDFDTKKYTDPSAEATLSMDIFGTVYTMDYENSAVVQVITSFTEPQP